MSTCPTLQDAESGSKTKLAGVALMMLLPDNYFAAVSFAVEMAFSNTTRFLA